MTSASTPAPNPPRRPRLSRLALLLAVALCALHGIGIWWGLEGWAGITNGWPIWRDDHPLYFHSAQITRSFLSQTGTTAGYDPTFMAGYAKSVVWPTSSALPEVALALFPSSSPELVYKLYVLASAGLAPWLVLLAAWLWRLRPWALALAVLLYLLALWTDFPINYATIGMLPYLLAVPTALLAAALLSRYAEQASGWSWAPLALVMTLAVLVHVTTAMILVPTALLVYIQVLWSTRGTADDRRAPGWPWHAGFLGIALVVLAGNAFWWAPGLWLSSTKGPSDFVFAHKEGLLERLWKIPLDEPPIQIVLWLTGGFGLVVFARDMRTAGTALLGFVAAGLFWGYVSAAFRSLDFLQPGRHTHMFYTGLAVAAAHGLERTIARLGATRPVVAVVSALVPMVGGGFLFYPHVDMAIRARFSRDVSFLTSRPTIPLLWIMTRVKRHARPGERLLYEEGGFFPAGMQDPYFGGRFSGIIARRLGIEIIGGPYLHASLSTNFTQFGEGKLFSRPEINREVFLRYAPIYRPQAILCWSDQARTLCRDNPDLFEIKEQSFPFLLARVKGFEGAAIVGAAEVTAEPGRLRVTRAEGGLDGSVVLRYHSVPCLRADPPVAWESVFLEDDPVPFIKLRPPLGPVTFELKLPPGGRGAPSP